MVAKVSKARQAGQSVGALIGGLAVLGTLGYFFVLPVVGSFVGFQYRMSYYQNYCDTRACVRSGFGYKPADWKEQIAASHAASARNVCPYYLNGSTWDQWVKLRDLSWCADYPEFASK